MLPEHPVAIDEAIRRVLEAASSPRTPRPAAVTGAVAGPSRIPGVSPLAIDLTEAGDRQFLKLSVPSAIADFLQGLVMDPFESYQMSCDRARFSDQLIQQAPAEQTVAEPTADPEGAKRRLAAK